MPPKEIDGLRNKLNNLSFNDSKISSFKGLPVMDYAFFPGGNGLYGGDKAELSTGKTIVLGSNFGCVDKFVDKNGRLVRKCEFTSSATWSSKNGLRNTLPKTGIEIKECFFTNAWPFLHIGESNDDAPISEWLRNRPLMNTCLDFFTKDVLPTIKPRLIVALGKGPAAFLSQVWKNELGLWEFPNGLQWEGYTFRRIDRLWTASASFNGSSIVCLAITHPSKAHLNAKYRQDPYKGPEGEIRLLNDAARKAGILAYGLGE